MKMRRNKKLNRKGFTLIELLAVIVILAVIMVIASGSILSSMNEAKKKSLLNSAKSAADEFENKYADSVLASTDKIYGFDLNTLMAGTGTVPVTLYFGTGNGGNEIGKTDLDALNINKTDYDLANSFVSYDGTKFTVCFVATDGGTFNVTAARSGKEVAYTDGVASGTTLPDKKMWACSNGDTSWITGK